MRVYENGWGYKENELIGALSIAGNNVHVKSSLMHDYQRGMAIYIFVGILLLLGVSMIIKRAYLKDDIYRTKLEEEVDSNVRALENQAKQMRFQLYHDALTTLPNRNQLIDDLAKCKVQAIALVNVDDFKHINDLYGQEAGDEVLVSVAGMLNIFAKEHDGNVYKLHADEFAIGFGTITKDHLEELVYSLLEQLRRFVVITDDDYHVDVSATIGTALGGENLLACADMALKRAKSQRASYLLYNPSMKIKREYAQNIEWTRKLKHAIRDDRIVPFYQGIYRCEDKTLAHYEVLMRMIDNDGTPISPVYFLPIAKKNKLYHQLTRLVIEKSLRDFAFLNVSLSINLSIIDILNPDTVAFILSQIDAFPEPNRLSFEILESEGIESYQEVFDFLGELKARGCSIAIDDFGSGYSSFEHMLNLHVDLLKIDASLIRDIDTNQNARITTHAIVTFAKAIGVKVCAEYVHSEAIFLLLNSMGVDYAQGYYLAEPLPLSELQIKDL
jgi:diguanylate cyclase (GGDEF)-like protein